jgi:hypothetical protein
VPTMSQFPFNFDVALFMYGFAFNQPHRRAISVSTSGFLEYCRFRRHRCNTKHSFSTAYSQARPCCGDTTANTYKVPTSDSLSS